MLPENDSAGESHKDLSDGRQNEATAVHLASISRRHAGFLLLKAVSFHCAFASVYQCGLCLPGISSDKRNSLYVLGTPTLSL